LIGITPLSNQALTRAICSAYNESACVVDDRECRGHAAGSAVDEAHPDSFDPTALWDSIALPEGYASEGVLVESNPWTGRARRSDDSAGGRQVLGSAVPRPSTSAANTAQCRRVSSTHSMSPFTPTMPVSAFEIGQLAPPIIDGGPVPEAFDAWCALARPANPVGLPAASVPIGPGRDGLSVAMQDIGRRWFEPIVLCAAANVADAQLRSRWRKRTCHPCRPSWTPRGRRGEYGVFVSFLRTIASSPVTARWTRC
jgi:hypothetical protein